MEVSLKEKLESIQKELDKLLSDSAQSAMPIIQKMRRGKPTDAQCQKINDLLGEEVDPSSIYVVPFYASDNLIKGDWSRWHPDTLADMTATMSGCPLMFDHEWGESENTFGFIFDCWSETRDKLSVKSHEVVDNLNQAIAAKEGHQIVYAYAAIPSNMSSVIDAIERRIINACSTGGLILKDLSLLCPNCSETEGRDVDFREFLSGRIDLFAAFWGKRYDEDYICPHHIPDSMSKALGYPGDADYCTVKARYESKELSAVNIGNVPLAGVAR
ncbi:MAG: hypothetical protein KatS3mg087_0638 [Patescibacteria group bacterium]|nr:MAG: hypothetical protein KatS3mg087_0638 [Patescibacteria group bacterium]